GSRVEELFGEDAVVALDLPVVLGRIWLRALMFGTIQGGGEGVGAVTGAVVGDDPLDLHNPVVGEPIAGAVQEGDGGGAFLVVERLGICQARVPVDRGTRIRVSGARSACLRTGCGSGLVAVFAVGAPATAVGDAPDLLHVQVDHVPGMLGGDRLDLPVHLAVRVDEPPAAQPELSQVAGDRAPADRGSALTELEGDA